jgi:hypothetical protein
LECLLKPRVAEFGVTPEVHAAEPGDVVEGRWPQLSGWRPLACANPPPSLHWWLVLTVVVGLVPAPEVSSIKASRSFQRKTDD